jgi:hypothetical protein
MSVSGVSNTDPFQTPVAQAVHTKFQQFQTQFQKVGQDLQSGNLTQAQADFVALSQQLPSNRQASGSTTAPASTLAKAFHQLGQDLQAGNLAASRTDFATIQQDAQQLSSSQAHPRHHHPRAGTTSQQTSGTLQQDFTSLGNALQSGNLASAQQAYTTFQADLQQQFSTSGVASGSSTTPPSTESIAAGAVNLTA